MATIPELAADSLGSFLTAYMQRRFGASHAELAELVPSIARIALESIGNSDALYHNIEHTMLVTFAGHDIMRGRALRKHMEPGDYAHLIIACLTHDIGYCRGILLNDADDGYVMNAEGEKVKLPRGSSDAALSPYHVDRSKLYIQDRISDIGLLDADRIARMVEGSRFPCTITEDDDEDEEVSLMRAADLIGQLGDPHYMRKANALYWEFEEAGLNKQLGYDSPADLVHKYPQFYWHSVAPHIQKAIRYLQVTASGRQWIANLYSNVFLAEREMSFLGPQK